jgi:hypothetical protein
MPAIEQAAPREGEERLAAVARSAARLAQRVSTSRVTCVAATALPPGTGAPSEEYRPVAGKAAAPAAGAVVEGLGMVGHPRKTSRVC